MTPPEPDFIVGPTISPISVALEPAHNVLNSLLLLNRADQISGFDEWVARTVAALTPEQRHNNQLVLNGLYYATPPEQSWPSFPAYVKHLAGQNPIALRDRVFVAYAQISKNEETGHAQFDKTGAGASIDIAPLLESVDAFVEFLAERFPTAHINLDIESEAHSYLQDPPALQTLIVSHLQSMWDEIMAPEWKRVTPMLRASVDAFRQLNLNDMSKFEAAQLVLAQPVSECSKPMYEELERLILVPSAHLGPYSGKFMSGGTMWLLFGARIPEGVQVHAPDLSRAEILVRVGALSDDTRLRILKFVAEQGEKSSQDIMTHVELSQSAVSRHLKQLSATGYLNERRHEGAKRYKLNPDRIEDTLRAVSLFLLGK